MARLIVLLLAASLHGATATAQHQQVAANPIRKVVTMLQALQAKVTAEGKKETELFEAFMCYCKNGDGALAKSIADAEAKVGQLTADIESGEAEVTQLKADLKSHQTDRAVAKTAMAEATNIRAGEASTFSALSAESNANIAAATKATAAVSKGMSGSFLQTNAAQVLRNFVLSRNDMDDDVREELTAFLSNGNSYAPASGQIVGILKQLTDRMSKDLADATAAENSAIKAFNELMVAKEAEVNSLTKAIEEKMVRLGNLQVELVEMKEDLDDTSKGIADDKKFLADLQTNCKTKGAEHAENQKLRSQELRPPPSGGRAASRPAHSVGGLRPLNSLSVVVATIPSGILMFNKTMTNVCFYALGQHVSHTSGMSSISWCPVASAGYTYNYVFVEFDPGGRALFS